MVKKRKRAPGGGRKPNPNKKVMFSTRLEPEVMAALKVAAQSWPGKNVSTFTEYLINNGLRERDEARRDPALQGLLFLIATLAERIAFANYAESKELRPKLQRLWRQDLLYFNAFKLAVRELLDALEKPPGTLTDEDDPERIAFSIFQGFWRDAHETDEKIVEIKRRVMRNLAPHVAEMVNQEFLAIPRAWKAANTIDTAPEKLEEKGQ